MSAAKAKQQEAPKTTLVDAPLGELLSTRAAAGYLGIRIKRLRRAVYQREVRFLKDGGLLGFYRPWLDAWRDARTTAPKGIGSRGPYKQKDPPPLPRPRIEDFLPKVRRLSRG